VDPTRLDLFDLADQRLAWLDRRAAVLAGNIANADTPNWRARDLAPFTAALQQATVEPERTNPMHLAGTDAQTDAAAAATNGERALDGNDVRLDVELSKVADTETAQTLVTGLIHTYIGMFRTAMGSGGSG
jgi:flagellar basal-body rod protein FlgB